MAAETTAYGETKSIPFVYPKPPTFNTVEEERLHRKQRLAAGFRLFAKYGFDEGVAGHITVRDPEMTDCFWVNPYGMHFSQIKASDLSLINSKGEILMGRPVNAAAFAIHSSVHHARPDALAAAHSHSMWGKSFSCQGVPLLPISQDACAFYEQQSTFEDYNGAVTDTDEGAALAKALGNSNLCILRNHGLLTVGQTVDECIWWFVAAERCCQSQMMAEMIGKPIVLSHEVASHTRNQVGTRVAGWFNFQPMYDMLVKEDPSFLQ